MKQDTGKRGGHRYIRLKIKHSGLGRKVREDVAEGGLRGKLAGSVHHRSEGQGGQGACSTRVPGEWRVVSASSWLHLQEGYLNGKHRSWRRVNLLGTRGPDSHNGWGIGELKIKGVVPVLRIKEWVHFLMENQLKNPIHNDMSWCPSAKVNFMCQCDWPRYLVKRYSGLSVRLFLDESNVWVTDWVQQVALPDMAEPQPIEGDSGGRINSLGLTVKLGHWSSAWTGPESQTGAHTINFPRSSACQLHTVGFSASITMWANSLQ